MEIIKNIIIGAGPSGLAVAGRFKKLGVPFLILEKAENVGNTWRNHYDRLHLHTDKKYSSLPHFPFPKDFPTFIPKQKLIDYFEEYIQHFEIQPLYNQVVTSISRQGNVWKVSTEKQDFFTENVIVSTGYNRVAKLPHWENEARFSGEIIHSHDYKNGKKYVNKNVLVVGYGNSGAEIALDLFESGAKTAVSIRSPLNIVKRDLFGRSTQSLAIFFNQFGEKTYNKITKLFKKLTAKQMRKAGIPVSDLAPSEQIMKLGKVPVIDIGTLKEISAGNIQVLPDLKSFKGKNSNIICFSDGRELPFDAVILATGYHAHLEDFFENIAPLLNERGYPKTLWSDLPAFKGLYFLGFNTPVTGILWDIYLSSEKVVEKIVKG